MSARNDITGDAIATGAVSDEYRAGHDAIDWSVKRRDEPACFTSWSILMHSLKVGEVIYLSGTANPEISERLRRMGHTVNDPSQLDGMRVTFAEAATCC